MWQRKDGNSFLVFRVCGGASGEYQCAGGSAQNHAANAEQFGAESGLQGDEGPAYPPGVLAAAGAGLCLLPAEIMDFVRVSSGPCALSPYARLQIEILLDLFGNQFRLPSLHSHLPLYVLLILCRFDYYSWKIDCSVTVMYLVTKVVYYGHYQAATKG